MSRPTVTAMGPHVGELLTPAQRRVLIALCRPFKDSTYATPATNQQIADELVVSVDAVKSTLRALFEVFGVDALPQNQKRASLALQAHAHGRDHPPRPVSTRLSVFSGWLATHSVLPARVDAPSRTGSTRQPQRVADHARALLVDRVEVARAVVGDVDDAVAERELARLLADADRDRRRRSWS